MAQISSQERDFFINDANPTPLFRDGISAILKVYSGDPKLVNIYKNYKDDGYKQAIEDYFKSTPASVLDKEKNYIDKALTKKTGKAIRNRIDELLPNDQVNPKKPRLTEPVNNRSLSISAESDGNTLDESEQFDARNLLPKKRPRVLYSWENVINRTDIRNDSQKDWILDKHNISADFRNFQLSTIREIEKNPFLSFKTDFHKILTDKAIVHHLYENNLESNMSKTSSSKSASGDPKHDSRIFKTIECITTGRYSENLNFKTNNDNEDTFVHDMLHDLLKEIFRDPNFELLWANSESTSSKSRRCINKENSRGKKPDFKLLTNTNDEILFGEVKPPKCKNSSLLVCQDLIKLANFQSGTLDELIKKYGNRIGMASFGVWICGAQIHIYKMDLEYDGLYRMYLVADVAIPTQKSQFIILVSLLEALYTIKDSVSNVLEIITSNTSPSQSRSDYCRLPPPEPVKITIVGKPIIS
ncbi:7968_t:CDS:10 [Funneliformis caledonium]|uniref:7968_t:CDS:1 n=1 Tax=Funneliformis caledonium TaxID=1117310 RepID=A0A9N8Z5G3_9GLOM|nr:7968_t:CDS:10 [Funneliformis caledonium]